MRFQAKDLDLENTDNWTANCYIASGNEAGYFSIKMDPKTNEAILMLDKVCNVPFSSRVVWIPKYQYS